MNSQNYQYICTQLEKLRLDSNPYWNADSVVVDRLITFIDSASQCRVLEIGTSNGYTALRLVPALMRVGGHLVTIESHVERGGIAQEYFVSAGVEAYITLIRGHAPEIFSQIEGVFDIVFLDATKYEHIAYVQAILDRLSPLAMIIADNVLSHEEAMNPFVAYMSSLPEFVVEIEQIGDGLLIARRVNITD